MLPDHEELLKLVRGAHDRFTTARASYSAEVRLYTLFGIPYGTVEIHCYREPSLKEGSPFSLLR